VTAFQLSQKQFQKWIKISKLDNIAMPLLLSSWHPKVNWFKMFLQTIWKRATLKHFALFAALRSIEQAKRTQQAAYEYAFQNVWTENTWSSVENCWWCDFKTYHFFEWHY